MNISNTMSDAEVEAWVSMAQDGTLAQYTGIRQDERSNVLATDYRYEVALRERMRLLRDSRKAEKIA